MPTLKITVTVTEDDHQSELMLELDIDTLRVTPNPREALMSRTKAMVNRTLADAGLNFTI